MVDAHDVAEREVGAQALQPPRVALGGVLFPGVERISPELAIGREVVGRHAGDRERRAGFLVDLKQIGPRPYVGGITRHEDRRVADQLDPALAGRRAHARPLAEEKILEKRVRLGALGHGDGQGAFARRGQETVLGRPLPPGFAVVVILEREEERVALQPGSLGASKKRKIAVGQAGEFPSLGSRVSAEQNRPLGHVKPAVIHVGARQLAQRGEIAVGQQAGRDQRLQVDQVGVARERGETLVGRITVAGGSQRAHLPIRYPGGLEKIEETIHLSIEHADALIVW